MIREDRARRDRREAWIAGLVVFGIVAVVPLLLLVLAILDGPYRD